MAKRANVKVIPVSIGHLHRYCIVSYLRYPVLNIYCSIILFCVLQTFVQDNAVRSRHAAFFS